MARGYYTSIFSLIFLAGCLEQPAVTSPEDGDQKVPINTIPRYAYTGKRKIDQGDWKKSNFPLVKCATTGAADLAQNQTKTPDSKESGTAKSDQKSTEPSGAAVPVQTMVGFRTYPVDTRTYQASDGTITKIERDLVRTEVIVIPKPPALLEPDQDYCFEPQEMHEEAENENDFGKVIPAMSIRFHTKKMNFRFGNGGNVVKKFPADEKPLKSISPPNILFRFDGHVDPQTVEAATKLCWKSDEKDTSGTTRFTNADQNDCRDKSTVNRQLVLVESIPQMAAGATIPKYTLANFQTYALLGPLSLTNSGSYDLVMNSIVSEESDSFNAGDEAGMGNSRKISFTVSADLSTKDPSGSIEQALKDLNMPDAWLIPIGRTSARGPVRTVDQ